MAFCPNCGASLEEGAKFCTSCGASMASAGQPAVSAQPPQPATSSAGKNYETLGGWLLFFVIGYGLSALMNLRNLIDLLGVSNMAGIPLRGIVPFMGCNILIYLVCIVADVLTAVIIVKRRPDFLRLFQIISIVRAGASVILSIIGTLMVSSLGPAVVGGTVVTEFGIVAGAGIGLVLMTMYFCKSERVRVYMGSTEYLDTALFKIGV